MFYSIYSSLLMLVSSTNVSLLIREIIFVGSSKELLYNGIFKTFA